MLNVRGDFVGDNLQVVVGINSFMQGNIALSIGMILFFVIVAAGVGALFGYAASFFMRRLKESYLGTTLFAASQVLVVILTNYTPLIGGNYGIELPDPYAWAGN